MRIEVYRLKARLSPLSYGVIDPRDFSTVVDVWIYLLIYIIPYVESILSM
jgi:hypothetical protein